MRQVFPILFLLVCSCGPPPSYPLEPCDGIELCSAGFECRGFRCVQTCEFEGDCDLGFRCEGGYCLEQCAQQGDCTMGQCYPLAEGRSGNACLLLNLPVCNQDAHCGFNALCVEGQCEAQCWTDAQCPTECKMVRRDSGYCL